MKRVLVLTAAVLAIVAVSVFVIGAMLPRNHVASRTVELSVPPESLWVAITDVEAFPRWRPGLARVEPLPPNGDHPVWREHGEHGPMTFEAVEREAPTRLVTRIVERDLGFGGTWTYAIMATEHGSRITITEDGWVDSPLFRFMSRFVFGQTTTMDAQLRALAARFGASAEPYTPISPS